MNKEKPLLIMVTYNRPDETMRTLEALAAVTDFSEVEFVIVDNGSENFLPGRMLQWAHEKIAEAGKPPGEVKIDIISLPKNVGCPRALNLAMQRHRAPGQAVVKIDPDVLVLTQGWPEKIRALIDAHEEKTGEKVAMVCSWYDGVTDGRFLGEGGEFAPPGDTVGAKVSYLSIVIGHAVWHSGEFLDAVGFFDVLAPEHLYGFEDLLMSHKANVMDWAMLCWEGWAIKNIQRVPALGREGRDEHVAKMRPFYNDRHAAIASGGTLRTGPDGSPQKSI